MEFGPPIHLDSAFYCAEKKPAVEKGLKGKFLSRWAEIGAAREKKKERKKEEKKKEEKEEDKGRAKQKIGRPRKKIDN